MGERKPFDWWLTRTFPHGTQPKNHGFDESDEESDGEFSGDEDSDWPEESD